MPALFGLASNVVLINAVMALIALIVGFFSALWYLGLTSEAPPIELKSKPDLQGNKEKANKTERVNMAASQLRDLAQNVASDVGAHSELVAGINETLGKVAQDGADSESVVTDAVSQIAGANEQLQSRLADAEKKIQVQAEEIRGHHSEARTDVLTQLANRRAFDDALEKNISAFRQTDRPFSLLIFDVDHFKIFNDTHGHQAGDEVLRQVGVALKKVVKSTDLPCRYGGEEFALVMPNTTVKQGCFAAERVRKAIQELVVDFEGQSLKVTASIGLAEIGKTEVASQLIRRADDAVYAAKDGGRNLSYWNDGKECLPVELLEKSAGEKRLVSAERSNGKSGTKKQESSENTTSAEENPASSTLSQLPDRGVFLGELGRRISECHRFGVDLSIMYLKVKDYKHLEQQYGQAVGDLILDSVAQFVRSKLREMDLLSKLGLGEFVVLLPGSSAADSKLVGQRMQSAISGCTLPLGNKQLRLGIQWGVVDVRANDDAQRMISRVMENVTNAELSGMMSAS